MGTEGNGMYGEATSNKKQTRTREGTRGMEENEAVKEHRDLVVGAGNKILKAADKASLVEKGVFPSEQRSEEGN